MKDQIIKKLGLEPLPREGGFYRETYRSKTELDASLFGLSSGGKRLAGTAIYYLVTDDDFSALHRLTTDEVFHFYGGDPVDMVQISGDGTLRHIRLGSNILGDEVVQVVVPAGIWQGTRMAPGGKWALLGTTMAPGFNSSDFELGKRTDMLARYPEHEDDIRAFTRE